MKLLVLVILSILVTQNSLSQKIRFTDSTNAWGVYSTYWTQAPNFSTTYYEYRYSGTTTYGGVEYHILPDVVYGVTYLVREDTLANKVYYRLLTSGQPVTNTNEYVAYDYNLVVGDTFLVRSPQGTIPCTVVLLDSVLIQNVYHKYWQISGESAVHFSVLEGVGNLFTPTRHFNPNVGTAIPQLYCFSHRNTNPPISSSIGILDNVNSCVLEVSDPASGKTLPFPNPVSNSSILRLDDIVKGKLIVWNQAGQVIHSQTIVNKPMVPIGSYIKHPGMYFYRIIDLSSKQAKAHMGSFIRD